MIDYKYKDLFWNDGIDKQLKLEFSGGEVITNEDIYSESMEITESISSGNQLQFGLCEASSFKIKVANSFISHVGQNVSVLCTLNKDDDTTMCLGKFKVFSDKPTADRKNREIVAYDALNEVLAANVAEWYNQILPKSNSQVTLKQFRDSFFEHFGITQEESNLVNDSMVVKRTVEPTEISGKVVLTAICEINGAFGHIGRNGNFRYITLEALSDGLYPSNELYPEDTLYPQRNPNIVKKSTYISATYEDYITQAIDKLQIRQKEIHVVFFLLSYHGQLHIY